MIVRLDTVFIHAPVIQSNRAHILCCESLSPKQTRIDLENLIIWLDHQTAEPCLFVTSLPKPIFVFVSK